MRLKDTEIKITMGDITGLQVDAIVNAANNKFLMGGGVAGAIKKKGGRGIEEEAMKKGPIKIGEAIATSAGNLPSRYVIHAATMGMDFSRQVNKISGGIPPGTEGSWAGKTDEHKIRSSCRSALSVAEELKISSIAFPALGCGVGCFPLLASAKIMAQEIFRHLRGGTSCLQEIIFCLYDQEAYDIFQQGVFRYLEHVTEVLQNGPFITVDAIIEVEGDIVIIQRSNPPFGWALPGGFVDYGESVEEAVAREAKEETGLELTGLKQFHVYSRPERDPRFHTISVVFTARAEGKPQAGDDAAGLKVIKPAEIEAHEFAFDHKKVMKDYLTFKEGGSLPAE